jgi:hypothetical protein
MSSLCACPRREDGSVILDLAQHTDCPIHGGPRGLLREARPLGLPRLRGRIIALARRWAEKGGLDWSDEEWERELEKLRDALAAYDEAMNR